MMGDRMGIFKKREEAPQVAAAQEGVPVQPAPASRVEVSTQLEQPLYSLGISTPLESLSNMLDKKSGFDSKESRSHIEFSKGTLQKYSIFSQTSATKAFTKDSEMSSVFDLESTLATVSAHDGMIHIVPKNASESELRGFDISLRTRKKYTETPSLLNKENLSGDLRVDNKNMGYEESLRIADWIIKNHIIEMLNIDLVTRILSDPAITLYLFMGQSKKDRTGKDDEEDDETPNVDSDDMFKKSKEDKEDATS